MNVALGTSPASVHHKSPVLNWWSLSFIIKNLFFFSLSKLGMINKQKKKECWTSLVVQWLRLYAPTAEGMGSIPGQGTKVLHATWYRQKKQKEQ